MNRDAKLAVHQVLIVDDHPLVRAGLRELIDHEPDLQICGEAGDVHEGVRMVEQLEPDVVVVDLSLRGGSGLDLLKRVRAARPQTRMIVSSMHEEADFADRALSAGAMGYVSKHEPVETLLEALRTVLQGRTYLSAPMTERMLRRSTRPGQEEAPATPARLSDRELEVFEAIGHGRSTREIADLMHLSIKTIETHRENIKHKLGLVNNTDLIRRSCQWVLETKGEGN